jgi:transcriptional regulator with XRE-family HTH domain
MDEEKKRTGRRAAHPTPVAVRRAAREIGERLATWRRLQGLTASQVADRAGITRVTLSRLEAGTGGTSLENTLRVARALGIMDDLVDSVDPYASDIGRLRSDENLPRRVRHAPDTKSER